MVEPIDGRSKPRLPQTHYLDNRISTDPSIFAEEQEKIFAKVWQFKSPGPVVKEDCDRISAVRVRQRNLILCSGGSKLS
jgi:hypothetical protein